MNNKVLITGISGWIAKHTAIQLLNSGYEVLGTVRNQDLIDQLRLLDLNLNVNWPLVHYKSAVRYLSSKEGDVDATGGTNWQRYLPPRFQKRMFFPDLWTEDEVENWGRQWVVNAIKES